MGRHLDCLEVIAVEIGSPAVGRVTSSHSESAISPTRSNGLRVSCDQKRMREFLFRDRASEYHPQGGSQSEGAISKPEPFNLQTATETNEPTRFVRALSDGCA